MTDLITRQMHSWNTLERITTIRHGDRVITVNECRSGAPICSVTTLGTRQATTILALPWTMTHDDAVAYWSLHLLGQPTNLDAIKRYRDTHFRPAA